MLTGEAAFVRAIEANPDDDGLRLVFADWLEEQGDLHADVIRTRCGQIRRIKEKLPRLKSGDTSLKSFAAHHHRFQTLPPLPVAAIRTLEHQFGVRLPDDYFEFLVRVGEGGAGPSYGLYPFRRACHRIMAQPFPFEGTAAPGEGYELPEDTDSVFVRWSEGGFSSRCYGGCIVLADHGCCSVSHLVLTGQHRGQVWDYWGGGDGLWHPTGMSFLGWYESWLDQGLRDHCSH
jgi:uncharacterized protein (TIGR02996 family)